MSRLLDDYRRATRGRRCPVCDRDHYCLVSNEGGEDPVSVICTKVESPIPCLAAGGWLHRLREGEQPPRAPRPTAIRRAPVDFRDDAERYRRGADLEAIGNPLGLPASALRRLGIGFDIGSAASIWPEQDAAGRIVGLLRRFRDGRKRLRAGDRAGLFVPLDLPSDLAGERLYVVEGGSDAAAGLAIGRLAIGRHAALAGLVDLARVVRSRRPGRVVVIADRDDSGLGLAAARKIVERLRAYCGDVRLVETPAGVKDLREWIRRGDVSGELDRAEAVTR